MTVTVPVEMLNVAVAAPAATVTLAGAANTGDALFARETTAPPAGAAPEMVIVQVVLLLELSALRVQVSAVRVCSACRVSVALAVVPLNDAVRVAL